MKRSAILICLILGISPVKAATKESDAHKTTKSANQALSRFADGVHQTLHGAKQSANSGLQHVSDSVHHLWGQLTGPPPKK